MKRMRITCQLPFITCLLSFCSLCSNARAQYYYKDIITTRSISLNYLVLVDNKVAKVNLTPAALDPGQNLVTLQQTVYPSQKSVITYTKVPDATESWLKAYYDAKGLLLKTVDSSADAVTSSLYTYNSLNQVTHISSNSIPVNDPAEKEEHTWLYNANGQPVQMIKIKNNTDTTLVSFTLDEQGNVAEEKAVHKKNSLGTIFYYYDARKRLTDVAKFNSRANRILPEYMFEYNGDVMQLSQMIVVPEGSADYQTWKYSYDAKGLKEKETCYNKQKQMVASVAYAYTFNR